MPYADQRGAFATAAPARLATLIATALVVATLSCAAPHPVAAFSVLFDRGTTADDKASRAPRWSAEPDPFGRGTGLHDGIQVAVDANFAADLGVAEVAQLFGISESAAVELTHEAIRRALRMWESPVLQFDISLPGPAVQGTSEGYEIDLFAGHYPVSFFGFAVVDAMDASDRLLTNGQRVPGSVIVGSDVFINTTRVLEGAHLLTQFGVRIELLAAALQILIAHEFGHALGLGHPNEITFLDTDEDPYNEMHIDPFNPFADLLISSIPPNTPGNLLPVMWGGLSSQSPEELVRLLGRLTNPSLTFDDRGGRDVLYPNTTPVPSSTPTPSASPSPSVTVTPTPSAACPGDCDDDGAVTVDELVRAVSIGLGVVAVAECAAADVDGDGVVTVDEVIQSVTVALSGCPR